MGTPTGISLATKGMLGGACRVSPTMMGGAGGAGLGKDEDQFRPKITVNKVKISDERIPLSNESLQVTSVKMVID